jgi:hypothetical protein
VAGTMETSQATSNNQQQATIASIISTPSSSTATSPAVMKLATKPVIESVKRSQLNLDTFSPVNEHGSFEFDRVLKIGSVLKRTRKTKVSLFSYYPGLGNESAD